MVALHELKTWPPYFEAVVKGEKTFEVRVNDRGFGVGDILCLREWDPERSAYTGRTYYAGVPFILFGGKFGVDSDAVVMTLGSVPWERFDAVMIHRRELRTP